MEIIGTGNQSISIDKNTVTGTGTISESSPSIGFNIGSTTTAVVRENRVSNLFFGIGIGASTSANVEENTVTNCSQFIVSETSNNVRVSENTIDGPTPPLAGSVGVVIRGSQNCTADENRISDVSTGLSVNSSNLITLDENTVSRFLNFGVFMDAVGNVTVKHSNIQGGKNGILGTTIANANIEDNKIKNMNNLGVSGLAGEGFLRIDDNEISNCGLQPFENGLVPAVIFANHLGTPPNVTITNNDYSGNSSNLNFFIRCLVPSPPAVVTGNKTSTGLPTVVGP